MCLAVPGQITKIWDDDGTPRGRVFLAGAHRDVSLAYVPDIAVGDYTIIHMGFALRRIDQAEALETLELFRQMGAADVEVATRRRQDEPRMDAPVG